MSSQTVPEIVKRVVTRVLPRRELEERIGRFLGRHTLCVLATSRGDVPRATPIEYRAKGLALYMMGEAGTKLDNLRANPRVSVGIFDQSFAQTHDWLSVAGVQLTGTAALLEPGEPEFAIGAALFELAGHLPPQWKGHLIRIAPTKVELLDVALKEEDYAAQQVWEPSP
jgi:nitroimidazol reductase NimA-like FMN-containing flavoprotein (pyridoxamine 5'-phosphate oxidase superfamily)